MVGNYTSIGKGLTQILVIVTKIVVTIIRGRPQTTDTTMTRALLTDREREILSGRATDVKNPEKYRSNTRGRIETRLERLEDDLQVLDEHEPELAQQVRERICAGSEQAALYETLDDIQDEIRQLREEIEQ
jgi:hypothetical protein